MDDAVNAVEPVPRAADTELLRDLAAGGEEATLAWSILVRRYSHKMYAVARSFSLDQGTAEDLVQTCWLRLLERADQLRDPGALGAWLCAIVRNEARRLVTRRREFPAALGLDTPEGGGNGTEAVEAGLVRDERAKALRLAFEQLGEECRQLLRLLLAEPRLSYDEIAEAVGRPRGSLGPTRRRCLDQLRTRLPPGFEP